MAYKTISVIVTDAANDGAAVAAAAALAARYGAHLDVHCLGIDVTRMDMMPMGATAMILDLSQSDARARAAELASWAESVLPRGVNQTMVQSAVISNLGLDAAVARLVRYADLIVAGRPYGAGRGALQSAVVEAELFGSGAPVLIVPDPVPDPVPGLAPDLSRPFGRVLVAWNETDEAMTAVRAALPLLQAAAMVDVVMVDPPAHSPERTDPGGGLSLMLARQGVRAEVSILARTLPRVSEVLARFVREKGCDAVVMGAYGHSRFREAILGGVTRDMLEQAAVPLVMAH